jgi:hypothetical protein
MRGETKRDQKNQTGHPLWSRVLAPSLEHGNQSNEKYGDGADSKNLHQHNRGPFPCDNRIHVAVIPRSTQ